MSYLIKTMTNNKSYYSAVNLFLRSLLFSTYSVTSMVFYSFICLLSLLFPLRYRHSLIRAYMYAYMWVLKKVCHIDYQVFGLENIPKNRTGIILSKHQSTWETFYLPLIFHEPAIILKRELLWIPFFGWGLAASDPIAINRNDKFNAMQQIIQKGKKCLEQGRWVLMFPEGTRVSPGVVGNYRLGGARLAAATGYPVIPIAHNAGQFWPRRRFIKRPGKITVIIGPIIESQGRTSEEILAMAKEWIESTMLKITDLVNEPPR